VKLSISILALFICATLLATLGATVQKEMFSGESAKTASLRQRASQLRKENERLEQGYLELQVEDAGAAIGGEFFCRLAESIPKSSWLSQLELRESGDNQGYRFRLSGYSFDESELGGFGDRLSQSAMITDAGLVAISKCPEGIESGILRSTRRTTVKFELAGRVDDRI
jgi:Tfp pilus assembly protein PilN